MTGALPRLHPDHRRRLRCPRRYARRRGATGAQFSQSEWHPGQRRGEGDRAAGWRVCAGVNCDLACICGCGGGPRVRDPPGRARARRARVVTQRPDRRIAGHRPGRSPVCWRRACQSECQKIDVCALRTHGTGHTATAYQRGAASSDLRLASLSRVTHFHPCSRALSFLRAALSCRVSPCPHLTQARCDAVGWLV